MALALAPSDIVGMKTLNPTVMTAMATPNVLFTEFILIAILLQVPCAGYRAKTSHPET